MRHVIVGTAGHIDHGKSALVLALTGTDPDRWEEEKRRGITIDLGFAHLDLGEDLRIGFIDVPGHERFVKNMLAGVGGIDLVMLIVAGDESIKPQTREHFDICKLLGIRRGLVVITKSDLVEREVLDLVRLEVQEFVAGSFLAGAPMVAVSARTGEGLDELKSELRRLSLEAPAKPADLPFRLPIDRSFVMKGFGAVVTGTLITGTVEKEAEVEIGNWQWCMDYCGVVAMFWCLLVQLRIALAQRQLNRATAPVNGEPDAGQGKGRFAGGKCFERVFRDGGRAKECWR